MAISNHRLVSLENGQIQFRWKDYRDDHQQKIMTLTAQEFLRRFLLHVLPNGFQRIRYYGFLANRYRQQKLRRCRELLGMPAAQKEDGSEQKKDYCERYEELSGVSLHQCPVCREGRMLFLELLPPLVQSVPTGDSS